VDLSVLQPPDGTAELACLYVARLKAGPGFQTRGRLAAAAKDRLLLAAPHPVFNLAPADVGEQAGFESARMTGWRYLTLSGDQAVASVELAAEGPTMPARFSRITDGRMAESVTRAIAHAQRSTGRSGGRYFLGMLRLPALHVHALWLRHAQADGVHDLFVPLPPSPAPLEPESLLEPAGFMRALVELKARMEAMTARWR
jgi:hypothetical protein